tara:strand:- start:1329 stop:3197 length:1869 start_codon:yes stop_codon:yes gene_type:complete
MPLVKLQFKPGVNKEGTDYGNNTWNDSDKVRFRMGFPENIGGWAKYSSNTFIGVCRAINAWSGLDGTNRFGIGTEKKLYIETGTAYYDVTPIRASSTINNNPFAISSGSTTVTVTDTGHGAVAGDFVTFSGTASTGDSALTAAVLNAEYTIDSITDANTYVITATAASASVSGSKGGASVVAAYQINVGLTTVVFGTGWGVDTYGAEGYGSASTGGSAASGQLRIWSLTNYGEDLLANVRNGGIFTWDATNGLTTRAVSLASLSGASGTPTIARKLIVSSESRQVLALACDPVDDIGTQDTLLIRYSDSESLTEWTPDTTNAAGSLRLSVGSEIITGLSTKRDILVWTNTALHAVSYIGAPFFFGTKLLSSNTSIMGPNAMLEMDEIVYWMGSQNFYLYDGTTKVLPCSLRDDVFLNLNRDQNSKVFAASNRGESEVSWFYPTTGDEISHYVTYNYAQQIWYGGTLVRTAWIDRTFNQYPVAASIDNRLYNHEIGLDDGSTTPVTAINSYIESDAFELDSGAGYQFMFARRILPDMKFTGSSATNPSVTVTLTPKDFPGGGTRTGDANAVTRSASSPIEEYTKHVHIRTRGRSFVYRIENTTAGVRWQEGTTRLEVRQDGRR